MKSPHVGWNQIEIAPGSRLLKGVPDQAFVYYTHSYRAPVVTGTVAKTNYGADFSGVVERDNLFGVQFHPEKSGRGRSHDPEELRGDGMRDFLATVFAVYTNVNDDDGRPSRC